MSARSTKQLTGRHVLLMLLCFFGVMLIVNIIFTVFAVRSFTGEDVPKSYRQGLEYNKTIKARRTQALLGWSIKANSYTNDNGQTEIIVSIRDKNDQPVRSVNISGVLRHPTNKALDRKIELTLSNQNQFRTFLNLPQGRWKANLTANFEDEPVHDFSHDIWVK